MDNAPVADANQPQAGVGTGVRPLDAYVRVLHRISPDAVRVDETVTGARFVDRPRAEGVDVLHREQPVVILPVRPKPGTLASLPGSAANCGAFEKKNFTASQSFPLAR